MNNFPKWIAIVFAVIVFATIGLAILYAIYVVCKKTYQAVKRKQANQATIQQKHNLDRMQWIAHAHHILIYEKYKEYMFDWANKYGIENLAPYVKTYYVLARLNDDLCAVGIKPFLRNGTLVDKHHLKDYLIDSCKEINNTTLTQLCNEVIHLEQQYNISQNELLPFPCEEQLQNLNTKFVQFNNKYSLNDMIEEYFGKKYHKDCMGMFGIVQAGYTKQFLASKDKDADYDIFVGWYSDSCREYDTAMRNNPTLYGAYIAMSYHNEVCNGGFDQFWDYAENSNWDLQQIKTCFNKYCLPICISCM